MSVAACFLETINYVCIPPSNFIKLTSNVMKHRVYTGSSFVLSWKSREGGATKDTHIKRKGCTDDYSLKKNSIFNQEHLRPMERRRPIYWVFFFQK
jgi:hypothetical protein